MYERGGRREQDATAAGQRATELEHETEAAEKSLGDAKAAEKRKNEEEAKAKEKVEADAAIEKGLKDDEAAAQAKLSGVDNELNKAKTQLAEAEESQSIKQAEADQQGERGTVK